MAVALAAFMLGPATPASAVVPDPTPGTSDLTVAKTGTGTGTITSSDGLINFPSDSHQAYPLVGGFPGLGGVAGLTLTADPDPGSFFAGWVIDPGSGATSIALNGNEVTFEIPTYDFLDVLLGGYDPDDGDTLVTARFQHIGFPTGAGSLTVAKSGTGTGTVTSTDGLINCGADCSQAYGGLSQVSLTATPGPNSSFAGWNVAGHATNLVGCAGTGTCTFLVSWDNFFNPHTVVTATFNAVGTVAPATVTRITHVHQHGGVVTGPWHHGVRHLHKHTHYHTHPAS